jgi:hypothetical protein
VTLANTSFDLAIGLRGDSEGGDLKFGSGNAIVSIVKRSFDPSIGNVEVTLVSIPSTRRPGVIAVVVPRDGVDFARGFTFPLPGLVAETTASETVAMTTMDGNPMPNWIQYVPGSKSFAVTVEPTRVLPQQVMVRIGSQFWIVRITQRDR